VRAEHRHENRYGYTERRQDNQRSDEADQPNELWLRAVCVIAMGGMIIVMRRVIVMRRWVRGTGLPGSEERDRAVIAKPSNGRTGMAQTYSAAVPSSGCGISRAGG
jgi:hypothetical protein